MKISDVRRRVIAGLSFCTALCVGAMVAAQPRPGAPVQVNRLSQQQIIEKLDGKDANATVEVVTIAPGQKDSAHRHAGPVFGYVIEGEYQHAINDEPMTTYKAGQTFYEPSGSVHRVAQNPSNKARTRLVAVILHPRDVTDVTLHTTHKK
jgi:quercetin dioxygenase-like cupin family protein